MAITVAYSRIPGYPRESVSRESVTVVDKLQCDWTDRITLAKELAGFVVGGVLHRPHEYDAGEEPLYRVYAKTVDIDPIIGLDSGGEYTKAQLTVTYGTLSYDVDAPGEQGSTLYVTENLEPASEFITLPNNGLFWGTDHKQLESGESPAKIIRMVDWVYTIHHLGFIPAWIWTHPGTVNNAAITSWELGKSFAAETLLCGNPSLSREITSEGATAWTITIRMTYRAETWNKFPRPSAAGGILTWEYVEDAGETNIPIYTLADFTDILI